jgi:hypothetical protein
MIGEREIAALGPKGPLRGVLTLSGREDAPLAVLHPGSGPTDRDGDNPLGVRGGPYRLLAHALAAHGVDVARIDKRGMFASAAAADANEVTLDDYARDLSAWMDALAPRRPVLIGHSEGGLCALAAARRDRRARGLVLIAAPGRPLGATLRAQLSANPANAPFLAPLFAALAELEAGRRVAIDAVHPAMRPLVAPQIQGFLIDLLARDPAAMIASAPAPVLIVEGGRDLQIGPEDAARLAAARPDAERAFFAHMTHVLRDALGDDRIANLATYARKDAPLTPGLAERIAAFILGAP